MTSAEPGTAEPFFSIVIATHNRPDLLKRAVLSVLSQTFEALEVIIVIDGMNAQTRESCDALCKDDPRVRLVQLPSRANGHGASFARNCGWASAAGHVFGSLDDDDRWTDPGYLSRSYKTIQSLRPDVLMAQQTAVKDGTALDGPIWIENLIEGKTDTFIASADLLLTAQSFCHLNTCLIQRDSFALIGGLNEALRYEEDRDYYMRIVDKEFKVAVSPQVVAEHRVPNRQRQDNASTLIDNESRLIARLGIFQSSISNAQSVAVQRYSKKSFSECAMALSSICKDQGKLAQAATYARLAEAANPSFKRKIQRAAASMRSML